MLAPRESPYAQIETKDELGRGRKHYGHHLANTIKEQEPRQVLLPKSYTFHFHVH